MGPLGLHIIIRHPTLFIHAVLRTSPFLVSAGSSRLRHPPEPALKAERPARLHVLPALGGDHTAVVRVHHDERGDTLQQNKATHL